MLPCSDLAAQQTPSQPAPRVKEGSFPVSVQFSRVPSGEGWSLQNQPLTDQLIERTIENMILHGVTNLSAGEFSGDGSNAKIMEYAQSLGMKVDYTTNGVQLFKRHDPPTPSVYSPDYMKKVRERIGPVLGNSRKIENLCTLYPFMDEPFHDDTTSFAYDKYSADQFRKKYGYAMPRSYAEAQADPRKHLDLVNFQTYLFSDAWRQIYAEVKKTDPRPMLVMTHDSHNTMGGGVGSDSKYGFDDVFHWGGDFADMFVWDIYPYTMFDYRYGEHSQCPKPRMSQMHYTMAQMRNLTTTYGKKLGFWFGTYNEGWFRRYMNADMRDQYWGEREMIYTAVAGGCDFLMSGIYIPEEASHWEDMGKGLNIIHKEGSGILAAPKAKAKACFLFPRSQYVQLNEEYFNVAMTFELCMRAFGEVDIIHEEQITDASISGYKILVLADVKMLPAKVAADIEKFVQNGGIVIADCVPQMDELKKADGRMKKLFGVEQSTSLRAEQKGTWNPFSMLPAKWAFMPEGYVAPKVEKVFDKIDAQAYGQPVAFRVVSPRDCKPSNGATALMMSSGKPALVTKQTGKGKTYLFGFCLQDTYFQTWKDDDTTSREGLCSLVHNVFADTGIRPAAHSSNPDVEATVRIGKDVAYVFIINHEAPDAITDVTLSGLGFEVGNIVDVGFAGKPSNVYNINFKSTGGDATFTILAREGTPTGITRLLKVTPKK